jgi:hypothetical protein
MLAGGLHPLLQQRQAGIVRRRSASSERSAFAAAILSSLGITGMSR